MTSTHPHATPHHTARRHRADRPHRADRRHRAALHAVATLATTVLLVTGCGSQPADEPVEPIATPAPEGDPGPIEAPEVAADDSGLLPGLVARTSAEIDVFDHPDDRDPALTLPATTSFGSTTTLLVLHLDDPAAGDPGDGAAAADDSAEAPTAEGWVQVLLPVRPNGSTGWIRTADVELREVDLEVVVDLGGRELTVLDGDEPLLTTPVAIGDPDHPTPIGRFFVTDKLDTGESNGPYGPFALGLSGYSDVLTEFAGGEGQIGIHGTNDPDSIGKAASKGCVRVPNDVVMWLAENLPLGTPVLVQ